MFPIFRELHHEGLVHLWETDVATECPWLLREPLRGPELVAVLADDLRSGREESARRLIRAAIMALATLHEAGPVGLHGLLLAPDLRVEAGARVVLSGYGLLDPDAPDLTTRLEADPSLFSGVAPEVLAGATPRPAADFYALGVLLETARRRAVLTAERAVDDGWLVTMTRRLQADDPASRPGPDELLAWLDASGGVPDGSDGAVPLPEPTAPFVGRDADLEALVLALDRTRSGSSSVVFVRSEQGAGRTAFLAELARRATEDSARRGPHAALVLTSRCLGGDEPLGATRAASDQVVRFLAGLRADEAEILMPRHVLSLAAVLHGFHRLASVAATRSPERTHPDPETLRERAAGALRDLLDRIANRRPVLLVLDDAHAADPATVELLGLLMRPPDPPPLLLVLGYRPSEVEGSPFAALTRAAVEGTTTEMRDLELRPLPAAASLALVERLLEGSDAERVEVASRQAIVRLAGGKPGEIRRLVRLALDEPDAFEALRLPADGPRSRSQTVTPTPGLESSERVLRELLRGETAACVDALASLRPALRPALGRWRGQPGGPGQALRDSLGDRWHSLRREARLRALRTSLDPPSGQRPLTDADAWWWICVLELQTDLLGGPSVSGAPGATGFVRACHQHLRAAAADPSARTRRHAARALVLDAVRALETAGPARALARLDAAISGLSSPDDPSSDPSDDPYVAVLLALASAEVHRRCGRASAAARFLDRAETALATHGESCLWLRRWHLLLSVSVDGLRGRFADQRRGIEDLSTWAESAAAEPLLSTLRAAFGGRRALVDDDLESFGDLGEVRDVGAADGSLHALVELEIYSGRGARAWRLLDESPPEHAPRHRTIDRLDLRVRAALAALCVLQGQEAPHPASGTRIAQIRRGLASDLDTMERQAADGWGLAAGALHAGRAGLASLEDEVDADELHRTLSTARDAFDAAGLGAHAAVAARRLAQIDENPDDLAAADRPLVAQGVASPARFADLLLPGRFPAPPKPGPGTPERPSGS